MKIESYNIQMASQHTYTEKSEKSERLKIWFDPHGPAPPTQKKPKDFILDLSTQRPESTEEVSEAADFELNEEDKLKILLLQKFVEMLTGKKIDLKIPKWKKPETELADLQKKLDALQANKEAPPRQGWGLEYDYHEKYQEKEKMSFSTAGIVKTADGREINIAVELTMSRKFMQEQHISIRAGDAAKVDPLVINFGGSATALTNTKFSFDLDFDGTEDQISFISPASGFLALDLNNDGIINDGRELFGPKTGNGFAELAAYDEDGNGWIDENDSVFSKLRIWTKDVHGNDHLFALGEKGIGAIFLGHLNTPFSLKDSANVLHGQIARTGIVLNENGTTGIIQQVDLTV